VPAHLTHDVISKKVKLIMAHKIKRSSYIIFTIFLCGFLYSADQFKMPLIEKNVCPFECCTYGKWISHSPLKVYYKEADTSGIAFTISPNDSFIAITGNVHINRPGIVIVIKPNQGFTSGDTIYTLSYYGEGFYDVWYQNKIINVELFWKSIDGDLTFPIDMNDPKLEKYSGVLIQKSLMIWWVKIEYNNRYGWIKLNNTAIYGFSINEYINGMDSCS